MQVLNLHDQLNDWSCLMSGGLPRSKPIQYSSDSGGQICVKNVFEVFLKLLKSSSFQKSGSFRTKPKPKIRQLLKFIAGTKFFSDCRVSSFRDADQVDFAFFLLKAL